MIRTAAALAALSLATVANAQTPPGPTVVRGSVSAMTDAQLTIKTDKGPQVVALAPNWSVAVMKPVAIDAIQPGSFIGTTNVDKPDGTGTSTEIHVFPPGVRAGEGHYPWRGAAGSMMTNGDVTMVVTSAKGRELDIKYNGQGGAGVRHVVVPPGTPIVTFAAGDRSILKPGAQVLIFATTGPDGKLHAGGVTTGENGAAPPM